MIRINNLIRSATTLGYTAKAALKRNDMDMFKKSIDFQLIVLRKVEKLVFEMKFLKRK